MSKNRKDCGAGNKATAKEESDELRKTSGREPKAGRAGELVDVAAHTITYQVDRKQLSVLTSDFEIQEPGRRHRSDDWSVNVDFSPAVSKSEVITALKSIIAKIETGGLPATVRRIERRGADAIMRAQYYGAKVSAVYATLSPALRAKADRFFKDIERREARKFKRMKR